MDSLVSAVRGVVDSPELGEVVASGMSTITSRFSPLSPRLSPVSMLSVPQIVVESSTSYEAPVGSKDVCLAVDRVYIVPLLPQESQVSHLSYVQLSPNRVRADYVFDTMDVFPMYAVPPRNDGYFPSASPISPPNTLSKPGSPVKVDSHWERLGERSPDFETFGKIVQMSVEFTFPSTEFCFTSGTFGVERLPPFCHRGNFC